MKTTLLVLLLATTPLVAHHGTNISYDHNKPTIMCVSADNRLLYTINVTPSLGGKPGAGGGVVAFAINRENGSLKHLNTQPSMGANPTAVIIDKTNSRVLVANHASSLTPSPLFEAGIFGTCGRGLKLLPRTIHPKRN